MKSSPKRLFAFKRRSGNDSAKQSVEGFIAAVEAWANRVLAEAGIKVTRRQAWKVADERKGADVVHFALKAIGQANQLRHALDIAATKGDETRMQALWCAFQMLQFCGTAYAGKIVESETPLYTGIRTVEGGKKGGEASRKVSAEDRKKIKHYMATIPRGERMNAYRKLAYDLRLSRRTVERESKK